MNGDLVKGLELYEWRLKNKDRRIKTSKQNFILKKSKSLKGKKILIYEEQGLGDIIQFCRYLPLLKLKGAEVIFKVKRNMHKLISTLDNDLVLVDSFPKCSNIDFTVPLLSLPYVFNTSLKTIPSENSYLFADRKKITVWENTLTKETFKIGICWQGSKNKIDFGRSFPLSLFKGISKLSTIN